MIKIGEFDVWKHFSSYSSMFSMIGKGFKKSIFFWIFWKKIWNFEISFLKIFLPSSLHVLQIVSEGNLWSYLSPKLFCNIQITISLSHTHFSEKFWKYVFHTDSVMKKKILGMSSYWPESSSIKKFRMWTLFFIFIMSPYLQKIRRYPPLNVKNHPISQL